LFYLSAISYLDRDRTRGLLEEAVALARVRGDEPALGLALMGLGEFTTTEEQARGMAAEVAAIAERLRSRPVRHGAANPANLAAEAADAMSGYHTYRDMPAAIRWQLRVVEAAEHGGSPRQIARRLGILTWLQVLHGDVDAAATSAARARAYLPEGGGSRWVDLVVLSSALVSLAQGNPAEAASAIEDMVTDGLATGRHLFAFYGTNALVDALVDLGQLEEAGRVLRRVEDLLEGSDGPEFATPVRARRARLLRLSGRREDAARLLGSTEIGIAPDQLSHWHMTWLVEHALLADDPDEARSWLARLNELSCRTGVVVPPWERRVLREAGLSLDAPA
jgi:ATP/maltotriose-dependent transcriptional regulator MalT